MTANEIMKSIKDNLDSVEQNLEQIQCDDCISRQAVLDEMMLIPIAPLMVGDEVVYMKGILEGTIKALPSVTPQPKTGKWILASEVSAYYPCIACDEFGQTWIPSSVVKLKEKSYDGEGFNFNIEEFLRGKEIELDGQKAFITPREIIAWMPLPTPYEPQERSEKE